MNPSDTLRFALDDRINDVPVGLGHVPLYLLVQFPNEVQEFLKGSGKDVDPKQVMIAIEPGSLTIVASGLLAAASLWADVGLLQDSSALGLLDPKRAAIIEGWQAAARKNPHRSYTLADSNHALKARVDSKSDFRNRIEAAWMPVEKFLRGMVVDMGGSAQPNIHLRLDSGKTLIVAATQQLIADEEKNRLYRPALLHVQAEENLKTGELRNLALLAFAASPSRWDEAEFDKLVQKGTQAWADVPDNWLEDLRSSHA